MKQTTWIGPIDIIPAGEQPAEDGNGQEEVKILILHDPESGETIHYKMTQTLADKIARKMKAKNSFLIDEIQRAQARARIELPGNGAGPIPPELAEELQRRHN